MNLKVGQNETELTLKSAWYALYESLRQSMNSGSWPEGVTLADIEQAKKLLRL